MVILDSTKEIWRLVLNYLCTAHSQLKALSLEPAFHSSPIPALTSSLTYFLHSAGSSHAGLLFIFFPVLGPLYLLLPGDGTHNPRFARDALSVQVSAQILLLLLLHNK